MDRHTARKLAGTTQRCARGCDHRGAQAEKPGPAVPLVQAQRGWETQQQGFGFISMRCFQLWAPRGDLQPGSQLAAGLWHGAEATAALGWEHGHLFPSPARGASQAANWDTSPRHKQLDKHLRPHESPFPRREGGEPGEVQAQRVPAGCQTTWGPFPPPAQRLPYQHQLPMLTIISTSSIFSLQKQQLPGGDFLRAPPLQHTLPHLCSTTQRHTARRGTAAAISHAHIYGCKQLRAGSADSVNLCRLLPCLPGQLQ